MKKILLLFFMLLLMPFCFAGGQYSSVSTADKDEIILDLNTPKKDYNLKKTYHRNNTSKYDNNDDDEIEMPINFTPMPLQLLKQYQKEGF